MPRKNQYKYNIDRKTLKRLYVKKDLSQKQIADIYGCDAMTIGNYLRRYGLLAKQRNGKFQYPFYVNKEFFKNWSHDMAWLLGYTTADGCVRPHKYELRWKSIDYDLLEHVKFILETNYEIKDDKNTNCYSLTIYSKEIISDLLVLGVGPRKSLTVEFASVPDEYFWSYMRGITDGDGYVSPPGSAIRWQVTSNRKFLHVMIGHLSQLIGCPHYKLNPQGRAFAVGVYGKHACLALENMYGNDLYGLARKKKTALRAIKFRKEAYDN